MRTVRLVVGVVLLGAALLTTGCSREFGPGESPAGGASAPRGPNVDATADAARSKLALQVQDACYRGDPRAAWPRCARWVEETASSARTAAQALPGDAAVTQGAQAVAAGRAAFLGRGCGTTTGTSGEPADAGSCVAALGQARDAVRSLILAVGGVPGA